MSITSIEWERPILVGGSPSSGSTLLSVLIDAHPDIRCGPELSLFSHPFFWTEEGDVWKERLLRYLPLGPSVVNLKEWKLENGVCPYTELVYDNTLSWYGLDRNILIDLVKTSTSAYELIKHIYSGVLKSQNKRIWAEKSPPNLYSFGAFLNYFPKGKVVYLVRDGRDVVSSLMRRGFNFKRALSVWLVETAICNTYFNHPRVFRVRYEDLVLNPGSTLRSLFEFLDLEPDVDYVLNYLGNSDRVASDDTIKGYQSWRFNPRQPISANSIDVWKEELNPEQILAFSASYIALPVLNYGIQGQSVPELLVKLGHNQIQAPKVDSKEFARFVVKEKLFFSDIDYANPRIFQESFVKIDVDKLPKADFSWETLKSVVKLTVIQQVLSSQIEKQDDLLRRLDSLDQKQDNLLQKQDDLLRLNDQVLEVLMIARWLSENMRNKRWLIPLIFVTALIILNAITFLLLTYYFFVR